MGAGRKKETYTLSEKSESRSTVNCRNTARNLRTSDLGSVIFGCKNNTIKECLEKKLFGLPAPHISYVKNVKPGMPLFLFNYSDRELHGIFEAVSQGRLNIDPYGWTEGDMENTPFPAQVKFKRQMHCKSLNEDQFGPVISKNYYEEGLFWFELDHQQTEKLISMFVSAPVNVNKSQHQKKVEHRLELKSSGTSEVRQGNISSKESVLKPETSYPAQGKMALSYSAVVKNSSCPPEEWDSKHILPNVDSACNVNYERNLESYEPKQEGEHFIKAASDNDSSSSDKTHTEWVHSIIKPVLDEESESSGSPRFVATQEDQRQSIFYSDNMLFPGSKVASQMDSLDLQYILNKLAEDVLQLKVDQSESDLKFNMLQQELVESKKIIQQLTDNCTCNIFNARQRETMELRPSHGSKLGDPMLIIGGFNGASWLSDLDLYFPCKDIRKPLCPMRSVRGYTSSVILNDDLYVIGGGIDGTWYDIVESYNLVSDKWVSCPSLRQKKGSLAGVSLNEKIFALGGGNGLECLSEVEVLDVNIGRWFCIQSMLNKRFAAAAAELNGVLYVAGGYDGTSYLKSAERFDIRNCSWERIGSMSSARGCYSLVVLNDKLYAIGGFNGSNMVSTVEVYEPRMNFWMMAESMNCQKGYLSSAVIGDLIYSIGGMMDNGHIVDEIECYKEGFGWHKTSLKSVGRRAFSSAVAL